VNRRLLLSAFRSLLPLLLYHHTCHGTPAYERLPKVEKGPRKRRDSTTGNAPPLLKSIQKGSMKRQRSKAVPVEKTKTPLNTFARFVTRKTRKKQVINNFEGADPSFPSFEQSSLKKRERMG
jgi:hypothetical protein